MLWQLFYLLIGIIFGASIIVCIAARNRLTATRTAHAKNDVPTFFLNVLILNKDAVIKAEVNKKVKHGLFGVRQRLAGKVANKVVSPSKFTRKVAMKLVEGIPPKLKLQAIEATSKLCYVKGNYTVIAVSILNIDSLVMIGKKVDGIGKTAFNVGTISYGKIILNWLSKFGAKESAEFAMSTGLSTFLSCFRKLLSPYVIEILLNHRLLTNTILFIFSSLCFSLFVIL